MPLENALRPQARGVRASRPAPTPNWAFAAGTRGFTAVPFEGFLGPSSETADLTRILRRRLAKTVYHNIPGYSRDYTNISISLQFIQDCTHPRPLRRTVPMRRPSQLPHEVKALHQLHGPIPPLVVGVHHVIPAEAPADEVGADLVRPCLLYTSDAADEENLG